MTHLTKSNQEFVPLQNKDGDCNLFVKHNTVDFSFLNLDCLRNDINKIVRGIIESREFDVNRTSEITIHPIFLNTLAMLSDSNNDNSQVLSE